MCSKEHKIILLSGFRSRNEIAAVSFFVGERNVQGSDDLQLGLLDELDQRLSFFDSETDSRNVWSFRSGRHAQCSTRPVGDDIVVNDDASSSSTASNCCLCAKLAVSSLNEDNFSLSVLGVISLKIGYNNQYSSA